MNEQQIEGLPLGTKAVRVRIDGDNGGALKSCTRDAIVDIVADNVYGKIDLSLVPIPEGYERDGDDYLRIPKQGEFIVSYIDGSVLEWKYYGQPCEYKRIIVRKKAHANAYGKDIDSIAIPEGWEKVGFREPSVGEDYLCAPVGEFVFKRGTGDEFGSQKDYRRIIVKRKKKRYVVAKAELPEGQSLSDIAAVIWTHGQSGSGSGYTSTYISAPLSIIEE